MGFEQVRQMISLLYYPPLNQSSFKEEGKFEFREKKISSL